MFWALGWGSFPDPLDLKTNNRFYRRELKDHENALPIPQTPLQSSPNKSTCINWDQTLSSLAEPLAHTMVNVRLICLFSCVWVGQKLLFCVSLWKWVLWRQGVWLRVPEDQSDERVYEHRILSTDNHQQQMQDTQRREICEYGQHSLKALLKSMWWHASWRFVTVIHPNYFGLISEQYYLEKIFSRWEEVV